MLTRRGFVAASAAMLAFGSVRAAEPRRLKLHNPHTGESFDGPWHDGAEPIPPALAELNWLFRDHREGISRTIDPGLFTILWELQRHYVVARGHVPTLNIHSGYRTHATNEALRPEGAALNSYHLRGQAADVSVQGYGIHILANFAQAVQSGGLGIYWRSDFVHLDTGPKRLWYRR